MIKGGLIVAKSSQAAKTSNKTNAKKANSGNRTKNTRTGANQAKNSKNTKAADKASNNSANADASDNDEVILRGEIATWIIGALMLIIELANFGLCGAVTYISNFFFGLFGVVQFVIPVAILISVFFLFVNDYKPRAIHKVIFAFIVLLCIGMVAQMALGIDDKYSVKELFKSFEEHNGGGVVCGSLAFLLQKLVGKVGTYIIILLSIIICVVLFAEISLIDVIRNATGELLSPDDEESDYGDEFEEAGYDDGRIRKAKKNRIFDNTDIVVEDFSDSRKKSQDNNAKANKSILDNIAVLPDNSSSDNKDFPIVRKLPDGEEVHEITMDIPVNLPGENMQSFEINEVDKDNVRQAAARNNRGRKSIVPTVLPTEDIKTGNDQTDNDTADINKTDLFPEYNAYDEVDMPSDINVSDNISSKGASASTRKSRVKRNAMGGEVSGTVIDSVKDLSSSSDASLGGTLTNSEKEAVMNMENKTAKEEKNLAAKEVGNSDSEYKFPPLELLKPSKSSGGVKEDSVRENAVKLQEVLKSFGVNVTMTNYSCGPSVTRYEMVPEQGVKVSKITGLADDIMMNLAAQSIRIEAPIPGKSAVGIEIPNGKRTGVGFRELIDTEKFIKHPSKISFAVGKDIEGNVIVEDIAKMPHLLIAGATGSGKSVCTNTLIMSILYKARPDEVKLILVDPKQVELKVYNGIPHLLTPVVTDPKKAAGALNWAVAEMTDRYQKFSECNVRNIQGYNEKVEELNRSGDIEEVTVEKMPQIVIIVDELADLMMVAKAEVEEAIVRLAQLARAAGIHLVIATQRPSVDVVTGLIKANVPSRIALSVSSGIDSRTIIDTVGAEKLLGNGDMLFYPTMYPKPLRVQGAYISDDEVVNVVEFLKANNGETTYSEEMTNKITSSSSASVSGGGSDGGSNDDRDEYFVQAGKFIIEKNKASIGMLQRMFKIGFNRAARIMDQLSEAGVVGPEVGTKPREVLMSIEQFEEYVDEYF